MSKCEFSFCVDLVTMIWDSPVLDQGKKKGAQSKNGLAGPCILDQGSKQISPNKGKGGRDAIKQIIIKRKMKSTEKTVI